MLFAGTLLFSMLPLGAFASAAAAITSMGQRAVGVHPALANFYAPDFVPFGDLGEMAFASIPLFRRHFSSGEQQPEELLCSKGKKSCSGMGHPEICCNENASCVATNNSISGAFCCNSPDPIKKPCSEESLACDPSAYPCPASVNGGCCPWGSLCDKSQCMPGGGPTKPSTPRPTQTSSFIPDLDDDGLTGSQDPEELVPETNTRDRPWKTGSASTSSQIYMTFTVTRSTKGTATATGQGQLVDLGDPKETDVTSGGVGLRGKVMWAIMALVVAAAGFR